MKHSQITTLRIFKIHHFARICTNLHVFAFFSYFLICLKIILYYCTINLSNVKI